MKPRVVYISDDEARVEKISLLLKPQFFITFYKTADSFMNDVEKLEVDSLIIELKNSETSMNILSYLRNNEEKPPIPVFMVVDKKVDEVNKIKSLKTGVTDFIDCSMSSSEITARIQSRIFEYRKSSDILKKANLSIDRKSLECLINNDRISLTMIEFKMLIYFLQNHSRKIPKTKIIEEVWRDEKVNTRNLNTHMFNLRMKIIDWDYEILLSRTEGFYLCPKKKW